MSEADVCGVETAKVIEWRLPSLIYFLTKNRGKYKLPKYRLQDLYYALKSEDGIAYCDIFARILRQIRQVTDESPPPCIDTISEAVENFLSVKKRTKSHINLQKLIANKKMCDMDPETRARVASAFIDLLEEEYDIDLDVRFKDNAEETLINAGCDRLGNEYFYIIDDERLYMKGKSGRDVTLVVPPDLKYWDQFLRRFHDSDDDNERLLYTMIGDNIVPVLRYTLTDYNQAFHRLNQELSPGNLRGNEEIELRRIAAEQAALNARRQQASTPTLGGAGPASTSAVSDPPGSVKGDLAGDPSPPHSNHAAAAAAAAAVSKYDVDTPGSVGPANGAGLCNPMSVSSAVGSVPPPPTEMVHTPATPNPCTNGGPLPPHSNPNSVPTPMNCPVSSPMVGGPASVPSNRQQSATSSLFANNGPRSDPPASGFASIAVSSSITSTSVLLSSTYNAPPSVSSHSTAPPSSVTNTVACHSVGVDPSTGGSQQQSVPPPSSSLPEVFAIYPPPSCTVNSALSSSCSEPCHNFVGGGQMAPMVSSSGPGGLPPPPPPPPPHPGQAHHHHPAKLVFTCAMMAEAAKAKSSMGLPPVQYHSNHALVRQFHEREAAMQSGQAMMFGPEHLPGQPSMAQGPPPALAGGIKGPNENLTPEQLEKRRAKMAQIYQIRERCNLAPENPSGVSTMNGPLPPHNNSVVRPGPPHTINNCCPNSMGHPHQTNEEAQREWQKLLIQHQEEKIRQQQHMMVSAAKGGRTTGAAGPPGPSHMGPQGGPVFINQMGPGSAMPMGPQVGPPPPPPPHMGPGGAPGEMIPPGYGPMGPPHEMMGPHHGGPPQFYRPPQAMGAPPRRGIPYGPPPPNHPFSPGHMNPMMHAMEPVAGQKRPYSIAGPWPGQGMPPRPGMEMMQPRMPYDPMAGMVDMASGKPTNTPTTTGGGGGGGGGGGSAGGGGGGGAGGGSISKRRKTAKNSSSNQSSSTANSSTTSMTNTTTTVTSAMPSGPPSTVDSSKTPTNSVSAPSGLSATSIPTPTGPGSDTHIQAAPSPHGQYLNPYDGELTITRHVNSAYQEMNDKHGPPVGVPTNNSGNPANGTIVSSVSGEVCAASLSKANGSSNSNSGPGSGNSCSANTQNLTSASLASLARLSNQMPGGGNNTNGGGGGGGNASAGGGVNRGVATKSEPEMLPHHAGSPYIDVSRANVMDYNRPVTANNSYMHQYYPSPHAPPPQHHMNHMVKEEPPPPPPPPQMGMAEPPQGQMGPQPPPQHSAPPSQHLMVPQTQPPNAYRPPHPTSNGGQPVPQGPSPSASQQQLGNANVQVQAKAPNTIQYIPSEPPTAAPSQRGPPRMPPGMYDYLSVNGVDNGPPPAPNSSYGPGPVVSMHGPPDSVRPHLAGHGAPPGNYYPPPPPQTVPDVGLQRPPNSVPGNIRPPHPIEMGHSGHSGPYGPGQPPGDPFAGQPGGPRPHMASGAPPPQQQHLQMQQQQPQQQQQPHYQQQYSMGHQHPGQGPSHGDWGDYMAGPPGQPLAGHHQQYYSQQGPPGQGVRNPPAPPSVYGPTAPMM